MTQPPKDHGSDRYDYVEVQAPDGISPSGDWFDWLVSHQQCSDCNPNLFLRYEGGAPSLGESWHISVAHDDTCPWLALTEQQRS